MDLAAIIGAAAAVVGATIAVVSWLANVRRTRAAARRARSELRRQLYEELTTGKLRRESIIRHRAQAADVAEKHLDTLVRYATDCMGPLAVARAVAGTSSEDERVRCRQMKDDMERVLLG